MAMLMRSNPFKTLRHTLRHGAATNQCFIHTTPVLHAKNGLMERLSEGVVIGDGGFTFALEKRGYVKAYPWTPEAVMEFPEAVKQLHREFLRSGSDVMQTYTFFAAEENISTGGSGGQSDIDILTARNHGWRAINQAAVEICQAVRAETGGNSLIAGGLSEVVGDRWHDRESLGLTKEFVQSQIELQLNLFVANDVDFVIAEYFEFIEEMEWAIEIIKKQSKLPLVASMCIGKFGDEDGKSAGECAVRMAQAGAEVVGVNCHFGPFESLETVSLMRKALDDAGFGKTHICVQPLVYHTPDADQKGFIDLPEFYFGLEPRTATRGEIAVWAREAYQRGARFIGGCCGFEAYHIRAVAEELAAEHGGKLPEASEKHGIPLGSAYVGSNRPWVRARASADYWKKMQPATGRPNSEALSGHDRDGIRKS